MDFKTCTEKEARETVTTFMNDVYPIVIDGILVCGFVGCEADTYYSRTHEYPDQYVKEFLLDKGNGNVETGIAKLLKETPGKTLGWLIMNALVSHYHEAPNWGKETDPFDKLEFGRIRRTMPTPEYEKDCTKYYMDAEGKLKEADGIFT